MKGAGKWLKTEHLNARISASPLLCCRVAVVVAKSGHTIVVRNQLRRRLRELSRLYLIPRCSGIDFVLWALPGAYSTAFSELRLELTRIRELALTAQVE